MKAGEGGDLPRARGRLNEMRARLRRSESALEQPCVGEADEWAHQTQCIALESRGGVRVARGGALRAGRSLGVQWVTHREKGRGGARGAAKERGGQD